MGYGTLERFVGKGDKRNTRGLNVLRRVDENAV